MSAKLDVAFLGPTGSFSEFVARRRLPRARYVAFPSVPEAITWANGKTNRCAIVPIENSSGGMILETIDSVVDASSKLVIQGELALNVRLALLGRADSSIRTVCSHPIPLQHCAKWLQRHHPRAKRVKVASTSEAARMASQDPHIAALSTREAAEIYHLDVLEYPVEKDLANVTQFFLLGHGASSRGNRETSLVAALKNEAGSLCDFLSAFKEENVNVKRILSRPIIGLPNNYLFFASVQSGMQEKGMRQAMVEAKKGCTELRVLGSYPRLEPYD